MIAVDAAACVRCGACSTLAPEIFTLRTKAAVLRQPKTDDERRRAAIASKICPTHAAQADEGIPDATPMPMPTDRTASFVHDALYYRLFDEAEKARWKMTELAWDAIDRPRATPDLVRFVRDNAASELTTFTAARRFAQEFADDPDFTQWVTVWAYEEAKHPQALMRWLAAVGEPLDASFVVRGRWAAPFARSRVAMLATNVASEIVASAGYVEIARNAGEPVLASIAMRLAGDEARHAASFFRYAEREQAKSPASAEVLKVLHVWLHEPEKMGHPVQEIQGSAALEGAGFTPAVAFEKTRSRLRDVLGALAGVKLQPNDDLLAIARGLR